MHKNKQSPPNPLTKRHLQLVKVLHVLGIDGRHKLHQGALKVLPVHQHVLALQRRRRIPTTVHTVPLLALVAACGCIEREWFIIASTMLLENSNRLY